jgi:hypothetical protein
MSENALRKAESAMRSERSRVQISENAMRSERSRLQNPGNAMLYGKVRFLQGRVAIR